MKNAELQSLTLEELRQKLEAEKESLTKLKFAHAISPIENPMKIRESKKLIARIATTLRNKQIQNNKA
jgi:large subunit ribosomal protein L29